MATTPYIPVDCGFHDIIEAQAVQGRPCAVVFLNDAGEAQHMDTRVLDVYARGNEEFVILEAYPGQRPLRLDRLIRVAGVDRPDSCSVAP
jgi:Rho-binding antiterminator